MSKGGRRKSVRVYWDDAVIYKKNHGEPFPRPTKMLTYGELVKETKDYLIISHPLAEQYDKKLGEFVPRPFSRRDRDEDPTFIYIPKGMITKIVRS